MNGREDQKLLIKQATDLVRLVGQDIALKRQGREFVALCPFHDDKHPSMTIVPQKQIYHCFVCKAGGDVFSWVMNYHKMDFAQALQHLADLAGIQLEAPGRGQWASSEASGQRSGQRKQLLHANELALGFFQGLYRDAEHGAAARRYVVERGISAEMVESFQIGCAAEGWEHMVAAIRKHGWDLAAFEAAGLVSPRDRGEGHYDKLRHRLIFPICDALGRPIAFGGRKLRAEDEPKYLNSPETPLFNKSATLFGLHLAKQAIIKSATAVIVEGYTDVIACHQHGLVNVVATLGTALTAEHVAALRHYAEKVVLLFDADQAGQKAADHAVELFLNGSLDVAIGILPEGLDPADLLAREDGVERFGAAIDHAADAMEYQFDRLRQRFEQAGTLSAGEAIATEHLQTLAQLGIDRTSPIRRAQVLQRLADLLHMPLDAIDKLLKQQARSVRRRPPPTAPALIPAHDRHDSDGGDEADQALQEAAGGSAPDGGSVPSPALRQAQQDVIGCLLNRPELFHQPLSNGHGLDEAVTVTEFVSADFRRLYEMICDRLVADEEPTADRFCGEFLADLASRDAQALVALATQARQDVDARTGAEGMLEALLVGAVRALTNHQHDQASRQLRRDVSAASADGSEPADVDQLLRQIVEHGRNPNPARIAGFG